MTRQTRGVMTVRHTSQPQSGVVLRNPMSTVVFAVGVSRKIRTSQLVVAQICDVMNWFVATQTQVMPGQIRLGPATTQHQTLYLILQQWSIP